MVEEDEEGIEMKNKAVFKYNGGNLALLCSKCKVIMKTGIQFTDEELKACQGKNYLPPQYCDTCKENNSSKVIF